MQPVHFLTIVPEKGDIDLSIRNTGVMPLLVSVVSIRLETIRKKATLRFPNLVKPIMS